MKRLSIYILRDPLTNEPRFVGITKNLSIIRHRHPAFWGYQDNKPKTEWIKQLVRTKLRPQIEFVCFSEPHTAGWKREAIIAHLTGLGYKLFNISKLDRNIKHSNNMKSLWQKPSYRSNHIAGTNKNLSKAITRLSESLRSIPSYGG